MLEPNTQNIETHLKNLVGERNPYTTPKDLRRAGLYIREQFESWQWKVREERVPFDGAGSCNILGTQKNREPRDEVFVLAAHYDTVKNSPGADDNASAVAALLEVARCVADSPFKTPLVLAAFTLEEQGFVGSHYFIRQALANGVTFRGMISLEMVGFCNPLPGSQIYPAYMDPKLYPDTGDFIAVVGNQPSERLTQGVAAAMRTSSPSLPVEVLVVPGSGEGFDEVRLSDHSPFWENDIPAVMVTDTAFFRNPNYHQPTDTLDTLDTGFIREVAQGIAGFLESYLG